ncbi:FlgO family outer membrane protein [Desulfurivibrio sp. D14AmB]|uniref:FlgO family outer membrane protein n=1 Tax=Desulfurivibrio sp. D14AmB TaxID=3374370 RepID=UPI00376F2D8F
MLARNCGHLAGGILTLLLLLLLPGAAGQAAEEQAGSKVLPTGRYHYNYPHEIPGDYVFRTSRIFSHWELRHAAGQSLVPAGGLPRGPGEGLSDEAVVALVGELLAGGEEFRGQYTLAVSTPVNLRNLYATSSFGRLLGERMLGELQRAGVGVIDVRKTPALLISQRQGEYGLSRDMDELPFILDAQAVLVGTYAVTPRRVVVELRVLRNRDGRVLASASRNFDMDREIAMLLADESAPRQAATPVRIQAYE